MKNLIKKYGLISALIVVGVPVISNVITGYNAESFAIGEIIGYTSMIVAMAMVFVAMKHYRDNMNEGFMTFGEGMKLGLGISVIGGIAFALYNVVFVTWLMPDFNEQYFAYSEGLQMGTPEFKAQYDAMMEENAFMFSLAGGTILMFFTVFLIGFVESVIAALLFQRKPTLAA